MTTDEILEYYAKLLIIQYRGKTKAFQTIKELARLVVMDQLPQQVQDAFTLGTAVGVQLDVLGKYAGVTRYGYGLTGNPITLDDPDYTKLIQLAITQNNAGSSLSDIQDLIYQNFANEIFVYDSANMQMSYLITSSVGGLPLVEMFITKGLLPKPMGVTLASIIYVPNQSLFGFSSYSSDFTSWSSSTNYSIGNRVFEDGIFYSSLVNNNLNHEVTDTDYWLAVVYPFNTYDNYNTTWTWLSYDDTIIVI